MSKGSIKTAAITAESSGIELETTKALQATVYRVFGTTQKASPTVDGGMATIVCDVIDEKSATEMVKTVFGEMGRIDLVLNNAGFGINGADEKSSVLKAQAIIGANPFCVIRKTRVVLSLMRAHIGGRITNASSVQGRIPASYIALYSTSKHAVEGYFESPDYEVRG